MHSRLVPAFELQDSLMLVKTRKIFLYIGQFGQLTFIEIWKNSISWHESHVLIMKMFCHHWHVRCFKMTNFTFEKKIILWFYFLREKFWHDRKVCIHIAFKSRGRNSCKTFADLYILEIDASSCASHSIIKMKRFLKNHQYPTIKIKPSFAEKAITCPQWTSSVSMIHVGVCIFIEICSTLCKYVKIEKCEKENLLRFSTRI